MLRTSWLRNWSEAGHRSGRRNRRRPPARCRLMVEGLEDRPTPSTLTVNTALDEFDGGTLTNPAGPGQIIGLAPQSRYRVVVWVSQDRFQ